MTHQLYTKGRWSHLETDKFCQDSCLGHSGRTRTLRHARFTPNVPAEGVSTGTRRPQLQGLRRSSRVECRREAEELETVRNLSPLPGRASASCSVLSSSLQPPSSSVHGISQTKILEWVAIPFSRGPAPGRARGAASSKFSTRSGKESI